MSTVRPGNQVTSATAQGSHTTANYADPSLVGGPVLPQLNTIADELTSVGAPHAYVVEVTAANADLTLAQTLNTNVSAIAKQLDDTFVTPSTATTAQAAAQVSLDAVDTSMTTIRNAVNADPHVDTMTDANAQSIAIGAERDQAQATATAMNAGFAPVTNTLLEANDAITGSLGNVDTDLAEIRTVTDSSGTVDTETDADAMVTALTAERTALRTASGLAAGDINDCRVELAAMAASFRIRVAALGAPLYSDVGNAATDPINTIWAWLNTGLGAAHLV